MTLITWLLRRRHHAFVSQVLFLLGIEIPPSVEIGDDFVLHHRGRGVTMTPDSRIGNRVRIYQQVTLGRSDAYLQPTVYSTSPSVIIGDDAWIFPGAVVIGSPERPVSIGTGTIVGPNAVVTTSTGTWEVWGGVPARKIRDRSDVASVSSDDVGRDLATPI